ncbi:hypothetical protein QMA09_07665 [Planococcus sp. APC 3906]|nr:hypothetical protein [Planococcus sp. APC 3906]MDN3450064.1 hypothetical protein [Planococcus sp. APC 3906]
MHTTHLSLGGQVNDFGNNYTPAIVMHWYNRCMTMAKCEST